jgi:hypothetical protein
MVWAPDYVTTDEAAAYEGVPDDVDDTQIAQAVSTASRAVDRTASPEGWRQFGLVDTPEARYYTAKWSRNRGTWTVEIDDLMTVTGLEVEFDTDADGTYADAITAYRLLPVNAAAKGKPWTHLEVLSSSTVEPDCTLDAVRVTARWGWTDVPTPVVQATLLQASRLLARRNAPFGIAGSPESGSEMRLLARVDPDVAVALVDYRRQRLVVG